MGHTGAWRHRRTSTLRIGAGRTRGRPPTCPPSPWPSRRGRPSPCLRAAGLRKRAVSAGIRALGAVQRRRRSPATTAPCSPATTTRRRQRHRTPAKTGRGGGGVRRTARCTRPSLRPVGVRARFATRFEYVAAAPAKSSRSYREGKAGRSAAVCISTRRVIIQKAFEHPWDRRGHQRTGRRECLYRVLMRQSPQPQ